MSYDLMVFNPAAAPRNQEAFMTWYQQQAKWVEDHDYNKPEVSSKELHNWFMEIKETFPPMDGPYASDDVSENQTLADYSIGQDVIYVAFGWVFADQVYPLVKKLAAKHQVGFFDASGNSDIFFPDGSSQLVSIIERSKPWWKFWA